ncbi:MAG TPA: hypothetical protein VK892_06865 [Pyrinomonadaceae bacterium]|nr:hypothetical protein [Pyrinomonadaceae bacterium]
MTETSEIKIPSFGQSPTVVFNKLGRKEKDFRTKEGVSYENQK